VSKPTVAEATARVYQSLEADNTDIDLTSRLWPWFLSCTEAGLCSGFRSLSQDGFGLKAFEKADKHVGDVGIVVSERADGLGRPSGGFDDAGSAGEESTFDPSRIWRRGSGVSLIANACWRGQPWVPDTCLSESGTECTDGFATISATAIRVPFA